MSSRVDGRRKAIFLDRDGVLNVEKSYVHRIEDFEFLPDVFDVLRVAQEKGYALVVITNQAGIGRGYYTENDFHSLNEWMLARFVEQGVRIDAVYFSPYHPEYGIGSYKRESDCRKPGPGMIFRAAEELDLDLTRSYLVGDKESDIEAGLRAGVAVNVLVLTGHQADTKRTRATHVIETLSHLLPLL